ncbi:3639_t:CDS:2, partial [Scutellospora calospora]
ETTARAHLKIQLNSVKKRLENLDIEPLINARKFLKKALQEAETELEIAGAIKAFELRYIDVFSPKETFRVAELEGLIPNAEIVYDILSKHPYQFYAYGSRVKGTTHRTSDLDLCYQEDIPDSLVFEIKDEFTESNLPFIVELVN